MLRPLLAALALVVMAGTADARPNKAISFYVEQVGQDTPAGEARAAGNGRSGLSIAARDLGRNPTGWRNLWCAVAMNRWEKKAGRKGTGSASSLSFRTYGRKVPSIKHVQPGDIVVLKRPGGGHVGYALGPAVNGKIKLRSGNTSGKRGNRIVADGYYPVSRVIAVRRVS